MKQFTWVRNLKTFTKQSSEVFLLVIKKHKQKISAMGTTIMPLNLYKVENKKNVKVSFIQ